MARDWIPHSGNFVVLDCNIAIPLQNKQSDFCPAISALLDRIIGNEAEVIIPQIVRCEMLRNAKSMLAYREMRAFLDGYASWPTLPSLIEAACRLQALYCWIPKTKSHGQAEIMRDMIIGATAAANETSTGCCTYILSGDEDFKEPYFRIVADYLLENPTKRKAQYFYLYRPNRYIINKHWKDRENAYVVEVAAAAAAKAAKNAVLQGE